MFVIAGSVIKKVYTVPFRVRFPLKKNRILVILKLFTMVICGPISIVEYCESIMPNQDSKIMTMSKMRQESEKYRSP